MKALVKKIAHANKDYALFNDDDRIAVGISGGKDSTLLVLALNAFKKAFNLKLEIVGIHLNMGFGEDDIEPLKQLFDEEGIPFIIVPTQISDILKLHTKKGVIQCSLCSKLKKGAVIQAAIDAGYTKIAFAHHADDAIETLFLNAIYGAKLATFEPKMHLTTQDVTFIRPFIYVKEKDIENRVQELQLPILKSGCPVDKHTKRQEIKNLLNEIYTTYPEAHDNFITMLHNDENVKLWKKMLTR